MMITMTDMEDLMFEKREKIVESGESIEAGVGSIIPPGLKDPITTVTASVISESVEEKLINSYIDIREAFVPVMGLALLIIICLLAFVWGAHSAKRQKDFSYTLWDDRNHNRRYQTFT